MCGLVAASSGSACPRAGRPAAGPLARLGPSSNEESGGRLGLGSNPYPTNRRRLPQGGPPPSPEAAAPSLALGPAAAPWCRRRRHASSIRAMECRCHCLDALPSWPPALAPPPCHGATAAGVRRRRAPAPMRRRAPSPRAPSAAGGVLRQAPPLAGPCAKGNHLPMAD